MNYRRARIPGGCYFFTVVTRDRHKLFVDEASVSVLRDAVRETMAKRPFTIDAMVVLPDHLHCVWTLPAGDADYSTRWRLIKTYVTKRLSDYATSSLSRPTVVRGVWQRRYWEHRIRDMPDYRAHIDYIHYNPVRHGYASRPADWPFSSFARYVSQGVFPLDWGASEIDFPVHVGQE